MQKRVYSQSLKKMKKHDVYDCKIERLIQMQRQIKRQENIIKPRQKPIKSMIETRKQMIEHMFSKNKLEKQVDKVVKNLIDSRKLQLNSDRINGNHSYKHYRIETQPQQTAQNNQKPSSLIKSNKNLSTNKKLSSNHQTFLPKFPNSNSQKRFEKSYSRKLKTQQDLIERLYQDPKQKIIEYINIDNVIKHYRAGMTSLIKGVYFNPHNPYKKVPL